MRNDQTAGDGPRVVTDGTAGTESADGASASDLRQGYTHLHERLNDDGTRKGSEDPFGIGLSRGFGLGSDADGGFLGRPQGWER